MTERSSAPRGLLLPPLPQGQPEPTRCCSLPARPRPRCRLLGKDRSADRRARCTASEDPPTACSGSAKEPGFIAQRAIEFSVDSSVDSRTACLCHVPAIALRCRLGAVEVLILEGEANLEWVWGEGWRWHAWGNGCCLVCVESAR